MAPHSNIVKYLSKLNYRHDPTQRRGFGSERSAFIRSRFLNKHEIQIEDVEEVLNSSRSIEGKISDRASDSESN
jgi:hypothetical protein